MNVINENKKNYVVQNTCWSADAGKFTVRREKARPDREREKYLVPPRCVISANSNDKNWNVTWGRRAVVSSTARLLSRKTNKYMFLLISRELTW